MANSKELFNDLVSRVQLQESKDEIQSIIYLLFHHQLGITRVDVLAGKEIEAGDAARWDEFILRINRHEPIQYILGESEFYGRNFIVNSSVLIPRPETELIVREVIKSMNPPARATGTILDIGTGSGCLAITLAKELPLTNSVATDISAKALEVAAENARRHQVPVQFLLNDILNEELPLTKINVIVSNPPYITPGEKDQMSKNVLLHEPALALFVPQDNPLIFYRAIAQQAKKLLIHSGKVIVEINQHFGKEAAAIFIDEGFQHVSVKKDFEGKDRVLLAVF